MISETRRIIVGYGAPVFSNNLLNAIVQFIQRELALAQFGRELLPLLLERVRPVLFRVQGCLLLFYALNVAFLRPLQLVEKTTAQQQRRAHRDRRRGAAL